MYILSFSLSIFFSLLSSSFCCLQNFAKSHTHRISSSYPSILLSRVARRTASLALNNGCPGIAPCTSLLRRRSARRALEAHRGGRRRGNDHQGIPFRGEYVEACRIYGRSAKCAFAGDLRFTFDAICLHVSVRPTRHTLAKRLPSPRWIRST